jgi:integrase
MAKALTIRALETMKPSAARREIPDGYIAGLFFIVQPSGKASWAVRYRVARQTRKLTIGAYPGIDLKAARELARTALVKVAGGEDPAAEKIAARTAARRPADRDLVEKVVPNFIERYSKANTRESSWRETERILGKEIAGPWKGRRLSEITRGDVHELLDGIVDRGSPIAANRTLAALRRMCSWAVGRDIIPKSPCEGVKAPAAERSRDRVLSDDELRAAWKACDMIAWPFGPLFQLLILTGQRRDEVAEMRWSEIDLDARTWTLPKERVKNNVEHVVPLSDAAVAILASLPRIKGKSDFVFTTTGDAPVAGFSRAKERVDAYFAEARGKAADGRETPARWTLHDLRRTFASGCAKLGIGLAVIEKILNHTSGSFRGVAGVYQRHSFADEKRAALEAWGRFVETTVAGKSKVNVVAIRARS